MISQRLGGSIVLLMVSVLAWLLLFHVSGESDGMFLAMLVVSAILVLLADMWVIGKVSGLCIIVATSLPVAVLGAWTLTRSDALGAIAAITWLCITPIGVFLLLGLALEVKKLVAWSHRRSSSSGREP